jgi:hypothetical protein
MKKMFLVTALSLGLLTNFAMAADEYKCSMHFENLSPLSKLSMSGDTKIIPLTVGGKAATGIINDQLGSANEVAYSVHSAVNPSNAEQLTFQADITRGAFNIASLTFTLPVGIPSLYLASDGMHFTVYCNLLKPQTP